MTLNERISIARKQSGLSQEQLGEKLGVSRQAVSKWETGQTNPDVAYVAEMCRLFGVSSDWLLLGIEDSAGSAPDRCPSCQHVVTGLDNFCPNCGCTLHDSAASSYTLVLNASDRLSAFSDLMSLSSSRRVQFSPDSPLNHPLTQDEAQQLVASAPLVLEKGLSQDQVVKILDIVITEENFSVCPEFDHSVPDTPTAQNMRPASDLRPPRDHLSFGGVVCAVVVGMFIFLIVGSFL